MKNYSIIKVCNHSHVICESSRESYFMNKPTGEKILVEQPNYRGTGKALCGVLKVGESLSEWEIRREKYRKYLEEKEKHRAKKA